MTTPTAAVPRGRKRTHLPTPVEHTNGPVNNVVKWLLRSPLHGLLSYGLMLVTYTGRKSGNTFTTPVSYIRSDGGVVFFANHSWWHNFEAPSSVTLRIKGRNLHGVARAITNAYEIEPVVRAYLEDKGVRSAWMIGLKLKSKSVPPREELARAIADRNMTMVRVRPTSHTRIEI
jgi:hypothetical protein